MFVCLHHIMLSAGAGGTCVIRGCVPKKLLVYGAMFNEEFNDAIGFGWAAQRPPHDWKCACGRQNVAHAAALVLSTCLSLSTSSASSSSPARCPCTDLCFRARAHRLV
jgi:hypothetical protein